MAYLRSVLRRNRGVVTALGVTAIALLAWPGLWHPIPRSSWADTSPQRPANAEDDGREYVGQVAFAPDGRSMLMYDRGGPVARLLDLATGRVDDLVSGEKTSRNPTFLNPLYLEGGRLLLGYFQEEAPPGMNYHELRVWEVATGRELFRSPKVGDSSAWSNYVVSEDGSTLAYPPRYPAGKYGPPTVGVWKAAWGREPRTFPGVDPVALSGDGRTLAAVEPGKPSSSIAVWDVESGRRLATIAAEPTESTRCLALSSDGKRLAENRLPGVVLWDVETSTRRAAIDSKTWPSRFGAGDKILYQGNLEFSTEAVDEAWDLTLDPPRRFFEGAFLSVSGDGRRMIVASKDGLGRRSASGPEVKGPIEVRRMDPPMSLDPEQYTEPGATSFSLDGRFVSTIGYRWERSWLGSLARRLPRWLRLPNSGDRRVLTVRVSEVDTWRQIASIDLPAGTSGTARFSLVDGGRGVAIRYQIPGGNGTRVELWDVPVPPPRWPIALGLASVAIGFGRWSDARRERRADPHPR